MTIKGFGLLVIIMATSLSLQSQSDVAVYVRDYVSHVGIGDVVVYLSNDDIGYDMIKTTNAHGAVLFKAIPEQNDYRIWASSDHEVLMSDTIYFSLRSNQSRTIELIVSQQPTIELKDIEIVGMPQTHDMNRRDAEVSYELRREEMVQLPVESRDITRVLFRLPHVSQATGFYPESPNVSINGANSLFTSYLIDGMDNNERFLGGQKFAIPIGFTKDITVLTNNYSAEYGLTANGIVNVTTPSGGNEWGGEVFFLSRPGSGIDGNSELPQRDLTGNLVKDGFRRFQGGFGIGGPLQQDKTFLFLNMEYTKDLKDNRLISEELNVNETLQGENKYFYSSGKLDHRWSNKWRSSLRWNVGRVAIERQGGGLDGGVTFPSAGSTQDRNSALISSTNTYVSERFTSQTNIQYSTFRWNYATPNDASSPQVTLRGLTGATIGIIGHPGYVFDAHEKTLQWQQKIQYYMDDHKWKLGLGVISSDHQLFGGGVPAGSYTVMLNSEELNIVQSLNRGSALMPSDIPLSAEVVSYGVELRPSEFGRRQNIFSIYMEDYWNITDHLNVTLGLRYDYDNLSKGGNTTGDFNNIAPRMNFNYQLGTKSVLRGGYGLFYEKILYAAISDALQQNSTGSDYQSQLSALVQLGILPNSTDIDRITFDGNLIANPGEVEYLNAPDISTLATQRGEIFSNERRILNPEGYSNPYTHQWALGYQYQANSNALFYVDLVHNQSYDLLRLRNLNAAAPFFISSPDDPIRTVEQADASRPIAILQDEQGMYAAINGQKLRGVARNIVVSETAGRSRYFAAGLNFQKAKGESPYSFRINYTLSYLENNTEDINFRAGDANNFEAEWGPSINDRRHIINAIGTWYPLAGMSVTIATALQSGQPINRIPDASTGYRSIDPNDTEIYFTADLNGDGGSFGDAYVGNSDRYPGESRNNDRLPWAETFDLSLRYNISLNKEAKNQDIALTLDIFNIFNAQNASGYSNNATQSNQIQVGPKGSGFIQRNAGPPRQFQMGIQYLF